MKTPDKMFTTAVSPDDKEQVVFLFNHTQTAPANFEEILRDMLQHPVLKEVCRLGVLVPPDTRRDEFLITTAIQAYLEPDSYGDNSDALIHLGNDCGTVTPLNMVETFYACKLPHRTMIGCAECMDMETPTSCAAKKWLHWYYRRRNADTQKWITFGDPTEVRNQLKNRKDTLAGFVYISPRLTLAEGDMCIPPPRGSRSHDHCKPIDRPPDDHDFTGVAAQSAIISRSGIERGRANKFKATVCPTCLVQPQCPDGYDQTHCSGAYRLTEEEATAKILEEHEIPYGDVELATLLTYHCGELPFRVNNKKAHLSCEIAPRESTLKFGVVYDCTGYFEALCDKELAGIVSRNDNIRCRDYKPVCQFPLTPLEKAVLIELASQGYSPEENGHWHITQYRSLCITRSVSRMSPNRSRSHMSLSLHFRYNTKRKDRDWQMSWTVDAQCLGDVYEHYENLKTINKVRDPLSRMYKFYQRYPD